MKAKKSPLNSGTHYKTVMGAAARIDKMGIQSVPITIRVTHDGKGKSLSLEDGEKLLMIPLEPVEDLIKVVF